MKIKLFYDKYQMDDAIEFVVKKNKLAPVSPERVHARVIETMMQLAKKPDARFASTMGFLVVLHAYEKEGMDHDESTARFGIYVDPSLGCMDYDERSEVVDV